MCTPNWKRYSLGILLVGMGAAYAGADDQDQDGVDDALDACCDTPPGIPVDADGRPWGDIDLDCDVDLMDVAILWESFTGPLGPCQVDECALGTHNCDVNAICTDTPGGFVCTCDEGFEGDGTVCQEINECVQNPGLCGDNSICTKEGGEYFCACQTDSSDCDGALGCEVLHSAYANSCPNAVDAGSACGDASSGFGCPDTQYYTFANRVGRTSAWFHARMNECSNCCAYVEHRYRLIVPPGTDYDLYVYNGCGGTPAESSTNGTGQTETVAPYRNDDCGGVNNGTDFWIEVRYHSGASCSNWMLYFDGRQ